MDASPEFPIHFLKIYMLVTPRQRHLPQGGNTDNSNLVDLPYNP